MNGIAPIDQTKYIPPNNYSQGSFQLKQELIDSPCNAVESRPPPSLTPNVNFSPSTHHHSPSETIITSKPHHFNLHGSHQMTTLTTASMPSTSHPVSSIDPGYCLSITHPLYSQCFILEFITRFKFGFCKTAWF